MLPPRDGSRHCVDGSWTPTVLQDITYVVVALDPVASVRFLDAEAAVAAKGLKIQKYLALVRSKYGWYDASHEPHYEIDLYFVGLGLPKHPELDMDESMSVPIYPAEEHPQSRPPLHPSQPLPWADCYHHTLIDCFHADSGHIFSSKDSPATVSRETCSELREIYSDDNDRATAISRSNGRYFMPEDEDTDDDDVSSIDEGGSVVSTPYSGDIIEDILMNPQGLCPTFDVWLDLSVLGEVPDPVNFQKEFDRLKSFKKECDKRQKAKYKEMRAQRKEQQARTETWAGRSGNEETNVQDPKQDATETKMDQQCRLARHTQPQSLSRESSVRTKSNSPPSQKSKLLSSYSCFRGITVLTSQWTKEIRVVCARSRNRVIRAIASSRKVFVRPKEQV